MSMPTCECPMCQRFSRAYLRHLFISREMLGVRLNTVHNLWYYGRLMRELRQAVRQNRFEEYRNDFYRRRETDASETLVQDSGELMESYETTCH